MSVPETKPRQALCDLCDGSTKGKAIKTCRQCEVSYCGPCFTLFHPMRGPLAKHAIQTPEQAAAVNKQLQDVTCPEHMGKELDMFCVPCKRPICYLCDRVGGHHEHKVCDIQTALNQRKADIIQRANQLQETKKHHERFVAELQKGQVINENNYAEAEGKVSKEFKELQSILNSTESKVRSQLTTRKQHQQTALATEIKMTNEASTKIIEITGRVKEVLKETDPVTFLLEASHLEASLLESENVELNFVPPTRYDFAFIENYNDCLNSVRSLSYENLYVVPTTFSETNKTKMAKTSRNVLQYVVESSEKTTENQQQQGQVHGGFTFSSSGFGFGIPTSSSALGTSTGSIQFRCIGILDKPLLQGYNYIEFCLNPIAPTQTQPSSQTVSSAIAFCCSSSEDPPRADGILVDGGKVTSQVYNLGFQSLEKSSKARCKFLIKLDGVAGPGNLAVVGDDSTSCLNNTDVYPIRKLDTDDRTIRNVESGVIQMSGRANASGLFGQPGAPRQNVGSFGSAPGRGGAFGSTGVAHQGGFGVSFPNPRSPQTQSTQSAKATSARASASLGLPGGVEFPGQPSKVYVAICLNSPGYSIEVIENPQISAGLSKVIFQ